MARPELLHKEERPAYEGVEKGSGSSFYSGIVRRQDRLMVKSVGSGVGLPRLPSLPLLSYVTLEKLLNLSASVSSSISQG